MKTKLRRVMLLFMMILICTDLSAHLPSAFSPVATVEASSVKLNKKKATLEIGEKVKLKISGTKSTVKWKSSNKSVARVTKYGNVYGEKAGTATITATVNGKKYTCKVTVEIKKLTDNDRVAYSWILLRDSLKNPDSLKIHSIKIGKQDAEYGDGTIVKGEINVIFDYSAQNGYGGMNREVASVCFYPFDEEPLRRYMTSDAFDGYLVLSKYAVVPEFYDTIKIKVKDIQPLVDEYIEEENYDVIN